ncbi:MAG: CBS domain-containing protein [Candidatus Aenigmatarchaeota archaeon]
MQVEDIMSKDVLSLKGNDTISDFISLMESEHIHEVPIIEDGKLVGMVRFNTLMSKGVTDPANQKLGSIMDFPPPALNPKMSVEEAANIISKTGLRGLPVVDNKKVVGIVSIFDILEVAATSKDFRQTAAGDIMSEAIIISENSDIGAARVMMREKGISRIPVVDSNGKLIGIVTAFDMLRAIRQPKEKMTWYNMAAEMEAFTAMPVVNIMNKNPPTVSKKDSLNEVVGDMVRYKTSGITVVEDNVPVGVVTVKDLLEVYVAGGLQKGVYYHAIGLEDEDEFIVSTVHRMIGDCISKISSIYPVQFMFVHFKKYKYKGLKAKWSVRARVMTDKGMFISKSWGWDPRDAANDALSRLDREIVDRKKVTKDKIKRNARMLKDRMK